MDTRRQDIGGRDRPVKDAERKKRAYSKPCMSSQKVFETTSLGCGLVEFSGGGNPCDFVQQYY